MMKTGKNPNTTEMQYEEIVNNMLDSKIQSAQLDKEYYKKFKKILSAKQIYKYNTPKCVSTVNC